MSTPRPRPATARRAGAPAPIDNAPEPGGGAPGPPVAATAARIETAAMWRRERLLAAVLDELAAGGLERTTIAAVAARAGLDEAAFLACYADPRECLLAAYDSLVGQAYAHAMSAYRGSGASWDEAVASALATLARGVRARARVARACMLEVPRLGAEGQAHRGRALSVLEQAIAEMIEDAPDCERLAPDLARVAAERIWEAMEAMLRGDGEQRPDRVTETLLAELRPA